MIHQVTDALGLTIHNAPAECCLVEKGIFDLNSHVYLYAGILCGVSIYESREDFIQDKGLSIVAALSDDTTIKEQHENKSIDPELASERDESDKKSQVKPARTKSFFQP